MATELAAPVVVYHLWPTEGWQKVHQTIMGPLLESGLADAMRGLFVGWAAPDVPIPVKEVIGDLPADKVAILRLRHGLNEIPTLDMVHSLAEAAERPTPILYLHCRSAWRTPEDEGYQPALDHNAYMVHFLVERWREALDALANGAMAAGCNVEEEPRLHVSGNMWWARSDALTRLPSPHTLCKEQCELTAHEQRNMAEWWLGGLGAMGIHCLYTSGVHHYAQTYPRHRYALPCVDGRAVRAG